MRRQRGIALILVLMITGILGLLMLQVGLTAREHVARAQLLSDRADADLLAQSREAALSYTLLTEPWIELPDADASASPYAAAWNFRGEPFSVDGITYRVQDVAGLLPFPQPGTRMNRLVSLLTRIDVEPQRAQRLGAAVGELLGAGERLPPPGRRAKPEPSPVLDARESGAGFPLQSLAELRSLPDMDQDLLARLESLTTLYPAPGFNPLTAPPEVLALSFDGSVLDGLLELRGQGRLESNTFYSVAGVGADDFTTLVPGPAFRVRLRLEHAGIAVERETTFVVRPYDAEPLAVFARRSDGGRE